MSALIRSTSLNLLTRYYLNVVFGRFLITDLIYLLPIHTSSAQVNIFIALLFFIFKSIFFLTLGGPLICITLLDRAGQNNLHCKNVLLWITTQLVTASCELLIAPIKRFPSGRCPTISCSGDPGGMMSVKVAKHYLVSTVHQKGVKVGGQEVAEGINTLIKDSVSPRGRPRLPEILPCRIGHSFLGGNKRGTAEIGLERVAREGYKSGTGTELVGGAAPVRVKKVRWNERVKVGWTTWVWSRRSRSGYGDAIWPTVVRSNHHGEAASLAGLHTSCGMCVRLTPPDTTSRTSRSYSLALKNLSMVLHFSRVLV